MALKVKNYFVNVFGIDSTRIMTEGRIKPLVPSQEEGFASYIDQQRVEDNRVDIVSNSNELLLEAGTSDSTLMHPVQLITIREDPADNFVVFNVDGAKEALTSWSLDLTDETGTVKHLGPFMDDQESISGKSILGNKMTGSYEVVMTGKTISGNTVKKESMLRLDRVDEPIENGLRFSILFDFDKYVTVQTYKDFLTDIVAPLIADSGKVIIQGHTDIIGQEDYNRELSVKRADEVKDILEKASVSEGKSGIDFVTMGFGADEKSAPFGNKLAEERCYNRTVIIDIIPKK